MRGGVKALVAAVDVPSMGDADDYDDKPGILDRIDDAIVALPNPVEFMTAELLASWGPRLFGQRANTGQKPPDVASGQRAKIFGDGFPEDDFITCHAPSDP